MFSLELPHRGNSNEHTQYTMFNINHPELLYSTTEYNLLPRNLTREVNQSCLMSLHILIRNHEALWANVWKFTVESRVVSATEFICNMGRGGLQHGTAVETGKDAFCRTQIKEKKTSLFRNPQGPSNHKF